MIKTDSFGVEIEPGDYILSASTATGRLKLGRAKQGKGRAGRMVMAVSVSFIGGIQEKMFNAVSPMGLNVVVLRKHDGTVPDHTNHEVNAL